MPPPHTERSTVFPPTDLSRRFVSHLIIDPGLDKPGQKSNHHRHHVRRCAPPDSCRLLCRVGGSLAHPAFAFLGGSTRSLIVNYEESLQAALPLTGSLLNPPTVSQESFVRPDIDKLEAIVEALDTSADGTIEASEVKVLFAKLTGVPVEQIPDDHEEVAAFAGLSNEELASKLFETVAKEKVDSFYEALLGGGGGGGGAVASEEAGKEGGGGE